MPTRRELANAIRALSMDAVQKAKAGHPGAPMGMADIAQVLWCDYLSHNPGNPAWPNRDRFVMSNGHGSMLQYSVLHLTGYDLPIEELKQFRQLHSKTPGHPEYGYTPGVETTTGPLGQGLANAVGMALSEKVLAAQFNKGSHNIVDHYTYVFLGDGCLMEGISHESCSLAGTLGLGKLIAFYDDNGISIDGEVEGWFTDDTVGRFRAYGWHVIANVDGHDAEQVRKAIEEARKNTGQPTLICCKTIIGFGSPNKQGTEATHGSPLGDDEIKAAREELGWTAAPFEIPEDIYAEWNAKDSGAKAESDWNARFDEYEKAHPDLAKEFKRRIAGTMPADFIGKADEYIARLQANPEKIATRKASQNCLNAYGPLLPELLGGSADLAGSNLTLWDDSEGVSANNAAGNYIYYGVREFGMSAMMNGIALHGGFKPYGATFLTFMEYACNAVRLAALAKAPVNFVYTHDSIGLGEDGPTHQPIEQLVALRATPNLDNWRPCDPVESAVAWKAALLRKDGPNTLIFTRQSVPQQERSKEQVASIEKGGYILKDCDGTPDVLLIATGSEVQLAVEAADKLKEKGKAARVISMPCTDVFDRQDEAYRESVLPSNVERRVAVEALAKESWHKYVGFKGAVVGMDTFGESGRAEDLFKHFNITTDAVVEAALALK
ncbi:transketolase [Alteromonas pelagimontana]|uniref:Transketolase n=1 Tax=Alteromonas pelagimontana TaxID=1858656 RepID=A0A6M4MBN7_9ALTE|nr:transketolase [Alteromonas pelagimontana]QJR80218.1 transketolase [Alteromonas pelagimontana]